MPHLFLINFTKKRLRHKCFSLKTCKIFCRTHLVAASAGSEYFLTLLCNASKNAMQACFKSYRNQTRDIPLVSVWRENETFIAFFEECGTKKNSDHVFFDLPKLDTNGLHWISHRKSNHSGKEAVAQRCSVNGVLKNFVKFTGKHLWQSLFFNKIAGFPFVYPLKMLENQRFS